jgi:hypothetical protein
MGAYERQVAVERAQRRKLGHAIGCGFVADIISFFILPAIFGRWAHWSLITMFVIVPLAALAGYRWFETAHDWVVLQAYRLKGRL